MNNDHRISRAELVAHFRGNTAEADKYMELIDGYTEEGEVEPNGYITLGEWQEYFRCVDGDCYLTCKVSSDLFVANLDCNQHQNP